MAVLSDAHRQSLRDEAMRISSDLNVPLAVVKSALRAAVDATDDWIDDNAASFNSALPTAARNNLTAKQKTQLFMIVARKRLEVQ